MSRITHLNRYGRQDCAMLPAAVAGLMFVAALAAPPISSAQGKPPSPEGRISVFATAENYEFLTLCVKVWITQVNSGHRDRFTQPKNVQVVKPT